MSKQKGFTVLELFIVLGIVGIAFALILFSAIKAADEQSDEIAKEIQAQQEHGIYQVQNVECGKARCTITVPSSPAVLRAEKVQLLFEGDAYMVGAEED